jgi:hypothetical protein
MVGSLSGPRSKLRRAYKHIGEVEQIIEAFINSKPHRLVCEVQMDSPYQAFVKVRLRIAQEGPRATRLSNAVGDAVYDLRSALDHLVWELTIRNRGHHPREPIPLGHPLRRVGFPIFLDPAKFAPKKADGTLAKRGGGTDMMSGLLVKQRARIEALQPFGDPKHLLWVLGELALVDKHRHPHFTTAIHKVYARRPPYPYAFSGKTLWRHPGGPIKNNTQIARVLVQTARPMNPRRVKTYVDMYLKRTFGVAFAKGSPAEGQDVPLTLRWMAGMVSDIIGEFTPDLAP